MKLFLITFKNNYNPFLKIYLKIREYKGTGPLIAWMTRIIINTAITHYHKNRKHHFHSDIEEVNETDVEGFIFSDQISASGNSGSSVLEVPPFDNAGDIDFSTSALLYSDKIWVGTTLDHLLRPEQSLYSESSKVPKKYLFLVEYR